MSFHPVPPTIRVAPQEVAPDVFVLHSVQEAIGAPLRVYLNSMVIRGAEPVVVDTGTVANRQQWLEDAFGLVDPADVKYVYISHDDIDHTGNLEEVMSLCTNATIIASWALVERHSNAFEFPLHRCRWIDDGGRLDLADRRLSMVRPPFWDSPTTRGLFDHSTGVYWAVDGFATPASPAVERTVDELDPDLWREGMAMFAHNGVSPWLGLVDPAKYAAHIDRIQALGMTTIVGAHTPLITEPSIQAAFDLVWALPDVPAPPVPGQADLDLIVAASAVPA